MDLHQPPVTTVAVGLQDPVPQPVGLDGDAPPDESAGPAHRRRMIGSLEHRLGRNGEDGGGAPAQEGPGGAVRLSRVGRRQPQGDVHTGQLQRQAEDLPKQPGHPHLGPATFGELHNQPAGPAGVHPCHGRGAQRWTAR